MNRAHVNSEILDRLPPHDATAEMNLLGSLILDPTLCPEVCQLVVAEDFYVDANRRLFGHVVGLFGDGGKVDVTLLLDRLRSSGDMEAVGGAAYLAEVTQSVAVAAHAVMYAEIVAEKASFRYAKYTCMETLREIDDPGAEKANDITARAAERFLSLTTGRPVKTVESRDLFATVLNDAVDPKGPRTMGRTTGLYGFDRDIGGLYPGELSVLAARPSMGKTALATQIFAHFADKGRHTLFISLEMSAESLASRILAARAGIDSKLIRGGYLTDDDRRDLTNAAAGLPLEFMHLVDRSRMTTAEVRWEIMRCRQKYDVDLVVVDYLTRLQPADPRAQRYLQVGQMTGDLKQLALEFDVPVLCLAQLGRAAEAKGESRPRLSHLRESGDIEQDADVVAFLHRPERVDRNDWDNRGKAFLYVEKNRNGPTGDFELRFDAATGVFTDPSAVTRWTEFEEFA